MNTPAPNLDHLKERLRQFAAARDWGKFHSPKNLVMALTAEMGELVEHFQWLTESESKNLDPDKKAKVSEELADVAIYLIRLADIIDIDLLASAEEKIKKNEAKYPAARVKGSSRKYTEY